MFAQDFDQPAPSLDAMNRDRTIHFARQIEMRRETRLLLDAVDEMFLKIETDFADPRLRMFPQ